MIGSLIVVGLLLAAFIWFIVGGGDDPDRRPTRDVDQDELDEAERDVREAPDADSVRDWGPGAAKPQPPPPPEPR